MSKFFEHILVGMTDNNSLNGAKYSDWLDASDALEFYGDSFNFENDPLEEGEEFKVYKAVNMVIASNGQSINEAREMFK